MFIIETKPFYQTKRQYWVWFTANMLKASGKVLSSFKSIGNADHFKKTMVKSCRILAVNEFTDFFMAKWIWTGGCFLLSYTTREGQNLEGEKKVSSVFNFFSFPCKEWQWICFISISHLQCVVISKYYLLELVTCHFTVQRSKAPFLWQTHLT